MAPTIDRIVVYDNHDLSDYLYSDIGDLIAELIRVRELGYTKVDIDTETDHYGNTTVTFNAVRSRLETDEEYETRQKVIQTVQQRRYAEYLRLKSEFEA
jgi:hypothetical protein